MVVPMREAGSGICEHLRLRVQGKSTNQAHESGRFLADFQAKRIVRRRPCLVNARQISSQYPIACFADFRGRCRAQQSFVILSSLP